MAVFFLTHHVYTEVGGGTIDARISMAYELGHHGDVRPGLHTPGGSRRATTCMQALSKNRMLNCHNILEILVFFGRRYD